MARPREFDEDTVTEAAMNVFWEHGYDMTSITMLQEGTGLTTGSLYKAFKDKKSLFLIALRRYEAAQVAAAIALLGDNRVADPLQRVEALFRMIPDTVRRGDRRGCLLCSAAAGPSFDDDDISAEVDRLMDQLREAFARTLASVEGGAGLAQLLLTYYVGLRTRARARLPVKHLEQSVDALIDLVRSDKAG